MCKEGVISDVARIIYMFSKLLHYLYWETCMEKGNTNFIAGYGKIFTPKDEKKLAKGIGLIIMLFGFESIIFSILSLFFEGLGFYYGLLIALNFFSIFGLMIKDQVQGKS